MNWEIKEYNEYILITCNLNNKNYRRNNVNRFYNLIEIINSKDKKFILKCKTNISKEYLYLSIDILTNKLSFKLFSSIEECLKKDFEKEECILIYIYLKPYYSVLHWLNSQNCNLNKNGKFLISFLDHFNKHFNIPYCLTSDEAKIDCNGINIDLSLSQIFKYGETYYEKYGFEFDMLIYKNKSNLNLIKSKKHYLNTKKKIQNLNFKKLIKPLYLIEKKYFDQVINYNSKSLGNVMKDIIKNNCEAYYELLLNIQKNNKNLKDLIEIITDAKTSYIKRYKYNKSKKKKLAKSKKTIKS